MNERSSAKTEAIENGIKMVLVKITIKSTVCFVVQHKAKVGLLKDFLPRLRLFNNISLSVLLKRFLRLFGAIVDSPLHLLQLLALLAMLPRRLH